MTAQLLITIQTRSSPPRLRAGAPISIPLPPLTDIAFRRHAAHSRISWLRRAVAVHQAIHKTKARWIHPSWPVGYEARFMENFWEQMKRPLPTFGIEVRHDIYAVPYQ